MGKFAANGIELPPGDFGIPAHDPTQAGPSRQGKGRWVAGEAMQQAESGRPAVGLGRAVKAGGMVYISSVGPINPETGEVVTGTIKTQTVQCLTNLKAKLEAEGSSMDKVVWANWSLRDLEEFDSFNREWTRWFTGDAPVGQCTLMPSQQRRAGFRVSIGVIAEA
jgi:2-iminobutanoate/2-iminopropanoate deaminase